MSEQTNCSGCCGTCSSDTPKLSTEELTTSQAQQEPKKETDPTEQFDTTRLVRKEALKSANEVLERIKKGAKLNKKDITKALTSLTLCLEMEDQLVLLLFRELFKMAQVMANEEVGLFSLGANMKAIIKGLDRKGVVSETELAEIFTKEILPEELPKEEEEKKD